MAGDAPKNLLLEAKGHRLYVDRRMISVVPALYHGHTWREVALALEGKNLNPPVELLYALHFRRMYVPPYWRRLTGGEVVIAFMEGWDHMTGRVPALYLNQDEVRMEEDWSASPESPVEDFEYVIVFASD